MLEIFLKTLPFFALIGLGWFAGQIRFFTAEATAWLTKFVFYFALSAMLFKFSANLDLDALVDPQFILAYLTGSGAVWLITFAVAKARKLPTALSAMEAHTSMTGNTGFLGVPMLVVLLGPAAVGPVLMVLSCDLIVFSSIITIFITAARHGKVSLAPIALGLVKNPMIVSMVAGLAWAGLKLPMPGPLEEFMTLLGAAATPGALFAIGASLAGKSAEKPAPAVWLSFGKLFLHPAAIAITSLLIFDVDPFAAGVMIAAAALPVAGNVYILAQHFGVAPQRVSASILVSTAVSILTVPAVIHWVHG
ncbi:MULTISPECIES: AEC family transporter [Thioclava]|uniref:AEC family transporter n=1 Tax=Thioclava TaxID=285107 RepID=UPI000B5450C9|nr:MULTISPECIES: AEC family transporter [Thioclava]OWY02329.1 malate transporter [Thioclava sp. IC9]OWY13033.1 malate transporter [Thioclava sp. F34-6]OWY16452.1 malate transporter [Thioclava sp. JM3]PWE50036.1 AEC family transporter [Thioclava sp. NG1]WGT52163.1 AEC family transporter [Thioclava nitratireducens]